MKKLLILLFYVVLTFNALAQTGKCISGNCKTGQGKMRYPDSSTYDGSWVGGHRQGIGTFEDAESIYTGRWKADVKSDSGIFTTKQILHSEHRLYGEEIRIGKVKDGKLSGSGTHISLSIGGSQVDTMMIWKGNFVDDQLSEKGTWYLPHIVTAYSDSWTDNYHFNDGKTVQVKGGATEEGSYANGIITPKGGNVASRTTTTASTPSNSPSSPNSNTSSGSMLDYGVFNTHAPKLSLGNAKTYCFISTCSGRGQSFRVLSKITADIDRHSFDQIKAEASRMISNNGWNLQSALDYLGTANEMHISGEPGRDYSVSESTMYN